MLGVLGVLGPGHRGGTPRPRDLETGPVTLRMSRGREEVDQLLRLVIHLGGRGQAELWGAGHGVEAWGGQQGGGQRLRHGLHPHPHPLGVLRLVLAGAGQQLLSQHAGQVGRGGPL